MINPLILSALMTLFTHYHPYHTCLITIENKQLNRLEITIQASTEDLDQVLRLVDGIALIKHQESPQDRDSLIYNYIASGFQLSQAGTILNLNFLGKKVDYEECFIFAESELVTTADVLNIACSLFTEFNAEQSNIVHYKSGKKVKTIHLSRWKNKENINLED